MRRFLGVGLIVCVLFGMGSVQAAEREKTIAVRGGILTSSALPQSVSGSSELITGMAINCGASACNAAIYNAAAGVDATNANVRFDLSAAANSTAFVDLSDTPIRVPNGVQGFIGGTANSMIVFAEQRTP